MGVHASLESSAASASGALNVLSHTGANDSSSSTTLMTRSSGAGVYSCPVGAAKWAVLYRNSSGYPCVAIVSRNTGTNKPDLGSEYVLQTSSLAVHGIFPHPTDPTKVVVHYAGKVVIATFSDTTFSSHTTLTTTYSGDAGFAPFPDAPSKFAIFSYSDPNLRYEKIDASGSTATSDATGTLNIGAATDVRAAALSEDRGACAIGYSGNSTFIMQIFTISGGTLTAQVQGSLSLGGSSHRLNHPGTDRNAGIFVSIDATTEDALIFVSTYSGAISDDILQVYYYDKSAASCTLMTPTYATSPEDIKSGTIGLHDASFLPFVDTAHNGFGAILTSESGGGSFRFIYPRLNGTSAKGGFAVSGLNKAFTNGASGAEEVISVAIDDNLQYALFLNYSSATGVMGWIINLE